MKLVGFLGLLCLSALLLAPLANADLVLLTGNGTLQGLLPRLLPIPAAMPVEPQMSVPGDRDYLTVASGYSTDLIKSFGPVSIGKDGKKTKDGVAARFATPADRDAWYRKIDSIYNATKRSVFDRFGYPRGPVLGYARDDMGAISVEIYDKLDVTDETIDQIYAIVHDEAKKQGLDEIPVVFSRLPMPQLCAGYTGVWQELPPQYLR